MEYVFVSIVFFVIGILVCHCYDEKKIKNVQNEKSECMSRIYQLESETTILRNERNKVQHLCDAIKYDFSLLSKDYERLLAKNSMNEAPGTRSNAR